MTNAAAPRATVRIHRRSKTVNRPAVDRFGGSSGGGVHPRGTSEGGGGGGVHAGETSAEGGGGGGDQTAVVGDKSVDVVTALPHDGQARLVASRAWPQYAQGLGCCKSSVFIAHRVFRIRPGLFFTFLRNESQYG